MTQLATFHTTTGAIQFERKLKLWGISCTLKPIPRALHASCGLCVEFDAPLPEVSSFEALDKIYSVTEVGYTALELDQ